MTDATFTTTCARCAAPLESTDATIDAVSKAHEERCFITGDNVRWDYAGNWIEGRLDSIIEKSFGSIAHIDVARTSFNDSVRRRSVGLGGSATFRRIPTPGQTKPPDFETERKRLEARSVPLYDGLTAMQCYMKWADNRTIVERGGQPLYKLTPAQIETGRRAYQQDALYEHASELRAKVEASKERERMTVMVDLDSEEPW